MAKKMVLALLIGSIFGSIIGLYTTFVIQNLWNWFATSAFHVSEISFWRMYGFVLLVSLFTTQPPHEVSDDPQWKMMWIVLEACVPDDKRAMLKDQIDDHIQNLERNFWVEAILKGFPMALSTVLANTFALVIGWAVHTFLA